MTSLESQCIKCKRKWHTELQTHCDKCCVTYTVHDNIKHHCSDTASVTWNTVTSNFCSTCQTTCDKSEKTHCSTCHLTFDNINTHCCACKTIIDFNFNTTKNHCVCHIIYDKQQKHCCDCRVIFDPKNQIHCCTCKSVINTDTSVHCRSCHLSYNKGEHHCCKCRFISGNDHTKIHCYTCHIVYERGYEHCCKLRKSWDPTKIKKCKYCPTLIGIQDTFVHCCSCLEKYELSHTHCNTCHGTFENTSGTNHCCGCKKLLNGKKHCKKCCFESNIDSNEKHCCQCKKLLPSSSGTEHCQTCCFDSNINEKHCCICRERIEQCKCHRVKQIICEQAREFLNLNSITGYIFISCSDECNSAKKFEKGILDLGFRNLYEFINDPKNYIFAYHGTTSQFGVKNICCNGWDISKRGSEKGQVHGRGEYFTTKFETAAKKYTGMNGSVILSLIVNEPQNKSIRNIKQKRDEIWYVVDNPSDKSYCLPVAIIKYIADVEPGCLRKDEIEFLNRFNSIKKIQVQIDEHLLDYDDSLMKQVFENTQKGTTFLVTCSNNQKYEIDLIKKTQRNTKTNCVRNIVFS